VPKHSSKKELFAWTAEVGRCLGHAHRLELIECLAQGPRPVENLAAFTGQSIANASQHLQLLRRFGCVASERRGKQIIYRLADERVLHAIAALRAIAETNVAEFRDLVRKDFLSLDDKEAVSRVELSRLIKESAVIVVDVRSNEEFAAGHLPGALNIPIAELERRLSELPKRKEIVAYCRGPYCILSFEAASRLRAHGYRVRRMQDGFPEWKAEGRKVAEGASAH
jgi:ArsR family transcriptional regulator